MNLHSLRDVYVHELQDLYSAEKQITEALPKMVQAASEKSLKEAFSRHLDQTQGHLQRMRQLLDEVNVNPGNVKCQGMEGLLKEGEDIVNTSGSGTAKDAALIAAAQRVEHYEIAAYGAARSHAKLLGFGDAANTLQQTLEEEGETNEKLTKLAEGSWLTDGINKEAQN